MLFSPFSAQQILPRLAALFAASQLSTACAGERADDTVPAPAPKATAEFEAGFEAGIAALEDAGFAGVVGIELPDGSRLFRSINARDRQGAAASDTLVDTGSIAKTITAIAVLKLVDTGRLSLDAHIGDFFPDAPADKAAVTVRQLLTHSAGFPPALGNDFDEIGRDDFLSLAFSAPLSFAPGSGYNYSNVGFSILAAIVEEASGKKFEDYLIDAVLAPAGIRNTGYRRVWRPERSILSSDGKDIDTASWGGGAISWHLIGNGGMATTAADMLTLMRAFAQGEIISPPLVADALAPHIREGNNAPTFYGYGLVVEDLPVLGRLYWHNGGNGIFFARWTNFADKNLRMFVASTSRKVKGDRATFILASKLFDVDFILSDEPASTADDIDPAIAAPLEDVARAFVDTILNGDNEEKRRFIETSLTQVLQDFAPMEGHLAMFASLQEMISDREIQDIRAIANDKVLIEFAENEDGPFQLLLHFGKGTQQIAGIEALD